MKGLVNSYLQKFVLVLWIVSSFFVLFLLSRIDWVVHHELYDFGLQFSAVWADPYWFSLRLIYVCLAVPSVLSGVVLGLDFWDKRGSVFKRGVKRDGAKGVIKGLERNNMLVRCPNCEHVFSKPLVMLDFSGGKTRLVSVCPYCNQVLGEADAGEEDLDVRVVFGEEEKKRVIH